MFTPTRGDFLSLQNFTYEDFLVRIGCEHLVGKPRFMVLAHNLMDFVHEQGLRQDHLEPLSQRDQDQVVKEIGHDRLPVYLQEYKLMFEQGVRDRENLRYLVQEDSVDYGCSTPRGLFLSLEGAIRCGEKLVKEGTRSENLRLDVMLQRP